MVLVVLLVAAAVAPWTVEAAQQSNNTTPGTVNELYCTSNCTDKAKEKINSVTYKKGTEALMFVRATYIDTTVKTNPGDPVKKIAYTAQFFPQVDKATLLRVPDGNASPPVL